MQDSFLLGSGLRLPLFDDSKEAGLITSETPPCPFSSLSIYLKTLLKERKIAQAQVCQKAPSH